MNDQLQQALAAILKDGTDAVKSGVSFLQAELPDVIQQLLMWKLAQAAAMTAVCLAVILTFVFAAVKAYRADVAHDDVVSRRRGVTSYSDEAAALEQMARRFERDTSIYGIAAIVLGLLSILAVMGVLGWGAEALQLWLAPKVFLLEYASQLAKGK